jgi:chromosome segregation protein
MKLTKLELSGFKSFADTITLPFEHGVTAIVGPNGCGKSNVSDAVRWVLGSQSARLLRGAKMEDVIFQGAASRRPINLTEVSLFLDNSDGDLPIAYREVQITRRLSRSGQSDYLLNNAPVRLRDIHDLLRGTGLGSDAGVVIEAKMIDLLLSDRADERRSLFEEAAGIGLYRDRKHSTERRLEETGVDLQRVEDLIAEVQSQIRSLARQRGKAQRHAKLLEDKLAVDVTLARRQLARMSQAATGMETRHQELSELLPEARQALDSAETQRQECAAKRAAAEAGRSDVARRLSAVTVDVGKLDGDLALAAERLANAAARRERLIEERSELETRAQQAEREQETAGQRLEEATLEHDRIRQELDSRSHAEDSVRQRLREQRDAVRGLEERLQQQAETHRSLEGEHSTLEGDIATLRERASQAAAHHSTIQTELASVEERREAATVEASQLVDRAREARAEAERGRHLVAEAREREAVARADQRRAEETVAQLTARRQALEELERDRVGLAPGAAALLKARSQFGGAVLGPLSDFIRTSQRDAKLAERLLGEWMHAVLVRDSASLSAIQRWHASTKGSTLVLLPADRVPPASGSSPPLDERLHIETEAAAKWVGALLGGAEVLDESGQVTRHPTGAIVLAAPAGPTGPLQRRAELESLVQLAADAEATLQAAAAAVTGATANIRSREVALQAATEALDEAREAERHGIAAREDMIRQATGLDRELAAAEPQLVRVRERLAQAEHRLVEIDGELTAGGVARARLEEELGRARAHLSELETELESARENRVHWQVQIAHVDARRRASQEAADRSTRERADAVSSSSTLAEELRDTEAETERLTRQQMEWQEAKAEARIAVLELEAATADVETVFAEADRALVEAEQTLQRAREQAESFTEEFHGLELRVTELAAERRRITERVETEWRRPLAELSAETEPLDLDFDTLEAEAERIRETLEKIGPVNPLAMEEHAEELKRLEFLQAQRDDLVAARRSLLQAIREIDATARTMFMETFDAVLENFSKVFQTLFGGGECSLTLSDEDDPLDSEIEIHAAPRGKRTQRIHLLSSGERTLVAVSLLFSIYLTKPSPFCLMDEVDAPLDDANVGRFTRLLEEFKPTTQFIVITHNPRTMQSADAVYGVTMQEPGVSTVVGVRMGEYQMAEAVA